jgi:hypothetical protein
MVGVGVEVVVTMVVEAAVAGEVVAVGLVAVVAARQVIPGM